MENSVVYPFTKLSLWILKVPGLWLESPKCQKFLGAVFCCNGLIYLAAILLDLLVFAERDFEVLMPILLKLLVFCTIVLKTLFVISYKQEIIALHDAWDHREGLRKKIHTYIDIHFIFRR